MYRIVSVCSIVLCLAFAGIMLFGSPDVVVSDEMEAVRQGPQSVRSIEIDEEKPAPQKGWLTRFFEGVANFFKGLFTSEPVALDSGSVTSTTGLSVRSGPGSFCSKIGNLSYGAEVVILKKRPGWYKIDYKGTEAWVSSRYISQDGVIEDKPKPPEVFIPKEPLPPNAIPGFVNAEGGLNVRKGPGVDNKRMYVLKPNDPVVILDEKDGWYQIKLGSATGWVSGKYITLGKAPDKPKTPVTKKPQEVYVEVPQRTQLESANGKYQKSWCGPTALAMVYEYYGRKETTWKVAERIYDFKRRGGTDAARIVSDAQKNGFPNTTLKTNVDFHYLENNLKQGKPIIVGVEVAWQSGHYMVVVGMKGNKIIVNDPGRPGVRREFSKTWFLRQWEGRWRRAIVLEK